MPPGNMRRMLRQGAHFTPLIFTYEDWLLLCLISGVIAGTAAALAFGELTVQGAVLGAAFSGISRQAPGGEAVLPVIRQRVGQAALGWLAGLTVCSALLFGLLTFFAGMCLAASLSLLTMEKGLFGIAAFLLATLPQGLFYLLIWYIESRWARQPNKKIHLPGGFLLLCLAAAGAYAESFMASALSGLFS